MSENKQNFKAVYVKDEEELTNELGKFQYLRHGVDGEIVGMQVVLPNVSNGGTSAGAIMFSNWKGEGAKWDWNGNIEKPSLSPSIWRKGHWHGHLVHGNFISC